MEIEIISKTCIKPSSSTPSHLRTYKISLLDQFIPPIYFATALIYPNSTTNLHERSLVLKHSLSETLSGFYPLAGKIKDYVSIDCNDEGAYYTEATANITMNEYLTKPDLSVLNKLVPDVTSFNQNPIGAFVVMIQETTFACGGLALGLSVSHMVLDGTGLGSFVKAWALAATTATSNVEQLLQHENNTNIRTERSCTPYLDSPVLFPLYEPFPKDALLTNLWSPFARKGKVAVRRLLFDAPSIAKLKSEAATNGVENPSRVEVVSAIITKCVKFAMNHEESIAIGHAVNIRRRATPPIPDCSVGNYVWHTQAICTDKESHLLSSLVYHIRNSIRKRDCQFVKDAKEGGFFKLSQNLEDMSSMLSGNGMQVISFGSWCNFGLYNNSDFGWGKPIWVAQCTTVDSQEATFYNSCKMNDTKCGNGVEAWLYLTPEVAAALEKDDMLLQYASLDPSPLIT